MIVSVERGDRGLYECRATNEAGFLVAQAYLRVSRGLDEGWFSSSEAPSRKQTNYNFFSPQGSIPPILLKFTVGKNVRRIFVEQGQHSSNIPFCPRSASHSKCFHVREEQLLSRENMSRLLTYPDEPCNVDCIDLLIYLW